MRKLSIKLLPAFAAAGLLLLAGCADDPDPGAPKEQQNVPFVTDGEAELTDKVNVAEMSRVVASMFGGKDTPASRVMSDCRVDVVKDSQGSPAIYVVNMDGGGYILISATKKYNPILAYNPTGTFDIEGEMPPVVMQWLKGTAECAGGNMELSADSLEMYRQMWRSYERGQAVTSLLTAGTASRSTGEPSSEELVRLREKIAEYEMDWNSKGYDYRRVCDFPDWDRDDDLNKYKLLVEGQIYPRYIYNYAELTYNVTYTESQYGRDPIVLETTWDQSYPYNVSFPTLPSGKRAYTGCAAVAAAQIMYHYKYPDTFNWDAMPKNSGNKAVSDLMYALASGADAEYKENTTSISLWKMSKQLNNFGYHTTNGVVNFAKINSELNAGRPVIVASDINKSGGKEPDAHAWILDGGRIAVSNFTHDEWWTFLTASNFAPFEKNSKLLSGHEYILYHVNWGWGGRGDGYYYNIEDILPKPFNGSPDYTSMTYTAMIYEIYPKN